MRKSIFKKGEGLVPHVVFEGETRSKAFYTFKDLTIPCPLCKGIKEKEECTRCSDKGKIKKKNPPTITLSCDGRATYFEVCTCTHCSVRSVDQLDGKLPLCAYKIAIIKSLK